ncbi:fumarylacetoacetate hydrolase family protein [Parvibaculum sp. MBR-TMA-1.3b-4.2]|jgi:acylpyruvate hydrolase
MTDTAFFQSDAGIVRSCGGEYDLVAPGRTLIAEIEVEGELERLAALSKAIPLERDDFDIGLPFQPGLFVLVGVNYEEHAREAKMGTPGVLMFAPLEKGLPATTPGTTVALPSSAADQVDYEGEIGIVMGRKTPAGGIAVTDAPAYVAGLTGVIDLSARDVQAAALRETGDKSTQLLLASKSFPGFKPLGPGIQFLTDEELRNPDIRLETRVNGELRQTATASDMLFSVCECVSKISETIELQPGDVICSGTPGGVGFVSNSFLCSGDEVSVTVGALPPLEISIS